ncbi:MAG: hypothetical protein WBM86_32115, partial [Waterburya sp.]
LFPDLFSPVVRPENVPSGLTVFPQRTLALIGGEINLEGATLSALSGQIEVAAIDKGIVRFEGLNNFNYNQVLSWKDINLRSKSAIDSRGLGGGGIKLSGRNVLLREESLLLMQNFGEQPTGNIVINASNKLHLFGDALTRNSSSGILIQSLGNGQGGNLKIVAPQIILEGGAEIGTKTYSNALGGNVEIQGDVLDLSGFSRQNSDKITGLAVLTLGTGQGGNINISSNQVKLNDGASIVTGTLGLGNAGNIQVDADSIALSKANPLSPITRLGSTSFAQGNSGNVILETNQLSISQGSVIASVTLTQGNAGDVKIRANDFIKMFDSRSERTQRLELSASFSNPKTTFSGLIVSASALLPSTINNLFNQPKGNSGNVIIETPNLLLLDRGVISVGNLGTGDGGAIEINTSSLKLDNVSFITSATLSGNGGNISILSDDIQLLRNSGILSTAGGLGNGGNIFIEAKKGIIILDDSRIEANAFEGNGGNVSIKTQTLVSDVSSSVTASSELGIDGTIEIQVPESGQLNMSTSDIQLLNQDKELLASCLNRPTQINQIILSGNGGLPKKPDESIGEFPLLSLPEEESWS